MSTARRPGTISPKAKQVMLMTAACLGVLINTVVFVSANTARLSYKVSQPQTSGTRIVLLGAGDTTRQGIVPVRRPARTLVAWQADTHDPLVADPPANSSRAEPAPSRRSRGPWATVDGWVPAEAWRHERLRPE